MGLYEFFFFVEMSKNILKFFRGKGYKVSLPEKKSCLRGEFWEDRSGQMIEAPAITNGRE